jgi:hypothetical protein
MANYLYPTRRTPAERAAHVTRTIGDCSYLAAQRLAAEERYEAWAALAERERLAREAGLATAGLAELLASLRGSTGVALIRIGEWLRGRPDGHRISGTTSTPR